jgi:hypothetical protein
MPINAQREQIVRLITTNHTTGGATASATLDTIGFDYATIVVSLSAYATTTQATAPTIALSESDITDATGYATVVATYGSSGAVARQYIHHMDKRAPRKRYLKISVTSATAGTDNAMAIAAHCILGRKEQEPASTSDMTGNTSNDVVVIV